MYLSECKAVAFSPICDGSVVFVVLFYDRLCFGAVHSLLKFCNKQWICLPAVCEYRSWSVAAFKPQKLHFNHEIKVSS